MTNSEDENENDEIISNFIVKARLRMADFISKVKIKLFIYQAIMFLL